MSLLEINLRKLARNVENTVNGLKEFDVVVVTKVCCGDKSVAKALVDGGAKIIADSHIENLNVFKDLPVKRVLLRATVDSFFNGSLGCIDQIVISDAKLLKLINKTAKKLKLILMVESGLNRDGFNASDLGFAIKEIGSKGLELVGFATNTACQNGNNPLKQLNYFEKIIDVYLKNENFLPGPVVSGGNSSVLPWAIKGEIPKIINQLRLGEAIFLGHDTVNYKRVFENYTDVFKIRADIVEVRKKNGFYKAVLAIGYQDIGAGAITPLEGGSVEEIYSDHTTIRLDNNSAPKTHLWLRPDYYALLGLMTSAYIKKIYTS